MLEVTKVCKPSITITVQEQTPIIVETKNEVTLPVTDISQVVLDFGNGYLGAT